MKSNLTLVPIGGLGNRIYAICSAIVYCRQQNKSLEIIWFKDHGCNCPVKELFSINPEIKNVTLRDATFSDLILRDNPRRRNFWIPQFFQQFVYDRRIYTKEAYKVHAELPDSSFGELDAYKHIFMVSFFSYWKSADMWSFICNTTQIEDKVNTIIQGWDGKEVYGVHVRRTDNSEAIMFSPTDLYVKTMKECLEINPDLYFYLATDSMEVKQELVAIFGDRIMMSDDAYSRNTRDGIISAFVELNVLSRTKKILASSNSSFSNLAHLLHKTAIEVIQKS